MYIGKGDKMIISILLAIGIICLIRLVLINLFNEEFESYIQWNIYSYIQWNIYSGMALHILLGLTLGYIFWG